MARKRGLFSNNIVKYSLIVVVIAGGLLYASTTDQFNDLFRDKFVDSSTEWFRLPVVQSLNLEPISTTEIDCFTKFTLTPINENGVALTPQQSSANTGAIYVVTASLVQRNVAKSPATTVKEYWLEPKIRCDDKSVGSGQIGWSLPSQQTIKFTVYVDDIKGVGINIGTFNAPAFSSGDLNDNFEKVLPKLIIPASTIDAKAPTSTTPYNSEVLFVMSGEMNLKASGDTKTYKYFIGLNNLVQTIHLISVNRDVTTTCPAGQTGIYPICIPITIPNTCPAGTTGIYPICVPTTTAVQDQTIDITVMIRTIDNADLLSFQKAVNSLEQDPIKSSVKVTAYLKNYRKVIASEALPELQLFCNPTSASGTCPTYQTLSGKIIMTQQAGLDYFSGTLDVPLGSSKGVYSVKVTSRDRTQESSRGFQVEQRQTTTSIKLSCPSGESVNTAGYCAPTPISACPAGQTGTYPNCVTQSCPAGQTGTYPNCVTQSCQSGYTGTYPNCVKVTTCPAGQTGTPPNCVTTQQCPAGFSGTYPNCTPFAVVIKGTGAKALIKYDTTWVATGAVTNANCPDSGTVPTTSVQLNAFQLIGQGGICEGFRFSSIVLRPTLDISASPTLTIKTGTLQLTPQLFMSVNNPFPTDPTFTCTSTGSQLPNCKVSGHDFSKDPTGNSVSSNEYDNTLRKITATNEYQLALITLTSGSFEDKLRKSLGTATLKDGDTYSYLLQVSGKFDTIIDGVSKTVVISPVAITQTFTYNAYGGVICTGEQLYDEITKTCKPIPPPPNAPCNPPKAYDEVTGTCIGGETPPEPPICTPAPYPECDFSTQNREATQEKDQCGGNILICVDVESPLPKTPPPSCDAEVCQVTCPEGSRAPDYLGYTLADCIKQIVPKLPTGGCPEFYVLNEYNVCQLIGSGTNGKDPPKGGDGGACDKETYDFFKCLFQPREDKCKGLAGDELTTCKANNPPPLQITGATLLGGVIFVVVIIILVVVAVIIRRRSGGGGIIG